MQRVRLVFCLLHGAAALSLAACVPAASEPTIDTTSIAAAVAESQTAAAQSTVVVDPVATASLAPTADEATPTVAATTSETPTATQTPTAEGTPTPGGGPAAGPTSDTPGEPGTIAGRLGYPSEVIPRLRVYAWDRGSGQWRYVITNQNDNAYSLQVPPGRYIVFAYLNDGGEIAGGYTHAVLCGLSVECTDHSLYEVTVGSGQQVSEVDVTDWYGPPDSIPKPPG